MKPKQTPQWLHQSEFVKVKAPSRMRLLLATCFLLAVIGISTLWLRTKFQSRSQDYLSNAIEQGGVFASLSRIPWPSLGSATPNKMNSATNNDIWFLETSYRRKLTARAACSIESACVHNSNYTVHLLSTGNITDADCPYHRVLSTLRNFQSEPLNATAELAATPLASLHAKGAFRRGPFSTAHLSDFLRYAVLWKRGGVYLDTDVIVFKSLSSITNSVVYQDDDGTVANGILFFHAQHPVLRALMQTCANRYDPGVWATCGPMITSLLPKDAQFREQVKFLDKTTFLAVPYQEWDRFFDSNRTQWVMRVTNGSYGSHFWNKLSKGRSVTPGSGCAMDVWAKAHCPRVYELASLKSYL